MQNKGNAARDSGVELLKIVAMMLIVTGHTTGTWTSKLLRPAYRYNSAGATADIAGMVVNFLGYGGPFGNCIFFVCSAWFLLDRDRVSSKKICRMAATIWSVSVGILLVTLPLFRGQVALTDVVRSLFPTTLSANWYLTCYMIFYAAHPLLNRIVYTVKQGTLLRIVLVMDLLYLVANYVQIVELFSASNIVIWTALYFTVAYVKLYLKDTAADAKKNLIGLLAGIAGQAAVFLATNFLGLRFALFYDKVNTWGGVRQPLLCLVRDLHAEPCAAAAFPQRQDQQACLLFHACLYHP